MRKSEAMEQRREEALGSPLPFFAEPPTLANMDAVPTSLTKEEREILFIFLYYKTPISAFQILGEYDRYRWVCAQQLYLQTIAIRDNKLEEIFMGKYPIPREAPFIYDEKELRTAKMVVRDKEEQWNKTHDEEDGTFKITGKTAMLNTGFLEVLAEDILKIRIPSYSKIRKALQNLQFLSLINEREDSDQRTKLYFLNPTFYSNWMRRRTEWNEKVNTKKIDFMDVGSSNVCFYQLRDYPKSKEREVKLGVEAIMSIDSYLLIRIRTSKGGKPPTIKLLKGAD